MSNPTSESVAHSKPGFLRRHHLMAVAIAISGLAAAGGAIASTQPFASDNPFESSIPDAINNSGSISGIDVGEPSLGDLTGQPSVGDIVPNFPGLPDSTFPSTPEGIAGPVSDILNGGSVGDVLGGVISGGGGGAIPKIFKDILGGNMGGVLESILGVLTSQNEIFGEVSKVVLGDGWEDMDGDGNADTPPDPYKVRLPQEETTEEVGLLTRSEIVLRRDKANQYDQELGRAMAAPFMAEAGDQWLNANITTSSDMMQAGLASTQSAISKAGEATEATSTQDIVRKSAEISGVAATLQMQEMQQNAMLGESLWNMQRLESAQLQLAADASEAADEQNRRDRADRTASLTSAASQPLIIPVRTGELSSISETAAPDASSFFAEP